MYIHNNMHLLWSQIKSKRLKKLRHVSFEEIVQARLIGIVKHALRSNQKILLYDHNGYVWAVPCVEQGENKFFLKTIFPSRKFTKMYRKDL